MNTAKEYWYGHKPQWSAFWLIYILGAIIVPILISLLIFSIAPFFQVSSVQLSLLASLILFLFNPYYIYSWVSVWRCSNNANKTIYSLLSKAVISLHVLYFSLNIIMLVVNFK